MLCFKPVPLEALATCSGRVAVLTKDFTAQPWPHLPASGCREISDGADTSIFTFTFLVLFLIKAA